MVRSVTGNTSCISGADLGKGFQTIFEETCSSCWKPSSQIYEQGWMCLRPGCESHFQLCGVDATTASLTYTKAFLGAQPNPKAKKPAVHIPEPVLEAKNGIVTTPLFYHGWHCTRCGRLSCRRVNCRGVVEMGLTHSFDFTRTKWEHWECSSCGVCGGYVVVTRLIDSRFAAGTACEGQDTWLQGVLGALSECIFRKL